MHAARARNQRGPDPLAQPPGHAASEASEQSTSPKEKRPMRPLAGCPRRTFMSKC
jgi:hypothetical protein